MMPIYILLLEQVPFWGKRFLFIFIFFKGGGKILKILQGVDVELCGFNTKGRALERVRKGVGGKKKKKITCTSKFASDSVPFQTRPRSQEASANWDVPGLWPTSQAFARKSWCRDKSNVHASNKETALWCRAAVSFSIWAWRMWASGCLFCVSFHLWGL